MAETIDLESLTRGVLTKLLEEMRITKGAFLMIKKHKIAGVESVGYVSNELFPDELEQLFHKCAWPASCFFLLEELETDSEIKRVFTKCDIALAMPIRVEDDEVAILVFGPRRSGERYYDREISTLLVFAAEAGIAIQNAESYQAVKKFNEELEKTVAARTAELKTTQERELAKARDIARLKDEFVFVAAHELRAPVAAIKGFVELAAESKTALPRDIRHYINAISGASNNLVQLINDLLEIARSDEGTLKVETASVAVGPIIEGVLAELALIAKQRDISLGFEHGPHIPIVSADEEKVREVVLNLVNNAIKYNREGGFVKIALRTKPPHLIVEVRDNGYGIPKEDESKIFEKFFRAENAAAEGVSGTGLGLFICRMLVERMGGTITYSSTEGKGSVFAFSLPLEDSSS
jgi:signal transduction histidine kinase